LFFLLFFLWQFRAQALVASSPFSCPFWAQALAASSPFSQYGKLGGSSPSNCPDFLTMVGAHVSVDIISKMRFEVTSDQFSFDQTRSVPL
jgi:hypothetical protein